MFTDVFHVEYLKNPSLDQNSSFTGCHFSRLTFSDLRLYDKTIHECVFHEVTFQNCQFISTIFSECHFNSCKFENCEFARNTLEECAFFFSSVQNCHSIDNRMFNSFFNNCSFLSVDSEYDTFCSSSFLESVADDCVLTYSTVRNCFGLLPTCPEKGSFIGFKQLQHGIIAELEIPADACRTSGFSRKCRADCALTLDFYHTDGTEYPEIDNVPSIYDKKFIYTRGQMAYADSFNESRETCGHGIHFFLSFQEAVEHSQ